MREIHPRKLVIYEDQEGNQPFAEWLEELKDVEGKARILTRLDRLEKGNLGDCEPVGEGVLELRMFFGPGYRVYFAEEDDTIVVLLCGGDKSSQKRDAKKAKALWKEYSDHA